MIGEYNIYLERGILKGYFTTKKDERCNNFLIYNTEEVLKKGLEGVKFGFDFDITQTDRKRLISLIKEYLKEFKK